MDGRCYSAYFEAGEGRLITKSELDKIMEKLHDVAPTQEDVNLFYRCYFRVWNCLNVCVERRSN